MRQPLRLYLVCLAGMLAGLAWDAGRVPLDALLTLCSSADTALARGWLHWRLLPAAHGLMLAAALVAALHSERAIAANGGNGRAGRLCAHVGCLIAMSLGMALALPAAPPLAALSGSAATGMTLAMAGGMALGMVATGPLYRMLPQVDVATRPVRTETGTAT